MKTRYFLMITFVSVLMLNIGNCKEKSQTSSGEILEKRYASTRISVYADKALSKDKYLATLEKAEEVGLLEEVPEDAGKQPELAKIRLADGKEGYIKIKYLAGMPIVITEEIKIYDRPTIASRARVAAPKGKLGFILEQKGEWSQVNLGKISGVWVTKHWVESAGYTTDKSAVFEAREYEYALDLLAQKKKDEAVTKLQDLTSGSSGLISSLASEKLAEIEGGASGSENTPEATSAESEEDTASEDEPVVTIEESR